MSKKQLQILAIVIAKWSDSASDVYRLATHFDMELPDISVKRSDHYLRIEAMQRFKDLETIRLGRKTI